MNVLKALQKVIPKSETLGAVQVPSLFVSPEQFVKKPASKIRPGKTGHTNSISISELIKQHGHLVGKDSSYQKHVVKDYLSPFDKTPNFKRQDVSNDFDLERAKSLYKLKKDISQNINFQETQDEIFIKKILPFLTLPIEQHSPNWPLLTQNRNVRKIFPKDYYKEVPAVPDFNAHPHAFEEYIGLLTHTTFHFRNSSSSNGVIPLLLRTLLHPMNETTRPYHITETFNDMISFFYHKNDLASMRETFSLIKMSNCRPNVQTFNLMLMGLLQNSRNHSSPHEHRNIVFFLDQMTKNSVAPDSKTWEILFNFLQSKKGRSYYVERLTAHNVPVTTSLVIAILQKSDEIKTLSSAQLLGAFQQNGIKMDYPMFRFFVTSFLERNELDNAFVTVQHIHSEVQSGNNIDVHVTTDILNKFMCHFANSGNLALALQTFNTFTQEYHVRANETTFEMLFKALVRNGYGKNFPVVLQWIKETRLKATQSMRNNYWKVKADSIAKYNCKKVVSAEDTQHLSAMLREFKLPVGKKITYDTWRNANPAERKVLRYINCRPGRGEKTAPQKPQPWIKNNDTTKLRKVHYRHGIARSAIKHTEAKRIPYAANWYEALNSELTSRGIITTEDTPHVNNN